MQALEECIQIVIGRDHDRRLLGEATLQGSAQRRITVRLEELVQPLDVVNPQLRAHFAEILLRKLSRESLKSNQRRHHARAQRLSEGIDRALAAVPPCLARPMEQFYGPERPLSALSIVVTSVSATMRRIFRTDTPLRAAISFQVCPARRSTCTSCRLSMSIILSLAGDGISDDFLAREGYRQVARISGKEVVRIFGTRSRRGSSPSSKRTRNDRDSVS